MPSSTVELLPERFVEAAFSLGTYDSALRTPLVKVLDELLFKNLCYSHKPKKKTRIAPGRGIQNHKFLINE
jgi:hypothetical protein